MKNPTIRELVKKLSQGNISKEEFIHFLQKVEKDSQTEEVDEAFRELFDQMVTNGAEDKKEENQ